MSLTTTIGNLIKGVSSVLLRAGTLHQILSTAVAEGINEGIARAIPTLMKSMAVAAILVTGIFLLGLGLSMWAETIILSSGAGYVAIGLIFIAGAGLYWYVKK